MGGLRRFAGLLLLAAALPCPAQQDGDLQGQILYAFHTEDLNQLTDVMQSLRAQVKAGDGSASLRYHLAHAEYRYAAIAGARHAHDAELALSDCVDQLKAILDHDAKSVEALALVSACYADLANFRAVEALILRGKSRDRLEDAYKLAPRNPRVVLLMATSGLARAKAGSAQYAQALAQLRLAAELFDQSTATNLDAPSWGDAQAYLALGRQLQMRGDLLGARNWIERSLIAAPDYKEAQRSLAALAKR